VQIVFIRIISAVVALHMREKRIGVDFKN